MTKKSKDGRLKQLMRLGICVALIALIALVGAVMVSAEEPAYSEGLKFTSNGDRTCYVSGIGSCTDIVVNIPPTSPEGDAVTSIGGFAFYNCTKLANITIPEGVTSIGYYAFSGCSALTSITIPEGVTEIGDSVFSGCSSLKSIQIPDSVISIDTFAFSGCSSLTRITIPKGVTHIGRCAFGFCRSLTSIHIPDGVTEIADSAFEGCYSLTSIQIPGSMIKIGRKAFEGCSKLLQTHNDLKYVDKWVIGCESGITEVKWLQDTAGIAGGAFENCTGLTNIVIPEGVKCIGVYGFSGCSNLTSIQIPNSVTEIGSSAFEGCSSLTNIQIPDSVTEIGYSAFEGCSSLTSIKLPDGVITIDWSTFSGCCNLTSIQIPNGVTEIGNYAFAGCSRLNNIQIPDGVTRIGSFAFEGCSSLTSIRIPDRVTTIGGGVFKDCFNLISVDIPKGMTFIRDGAFENCYQLSDLVIPENVIQIGVNAFCGCAKLIQQHNGLEYVGKWVVGAESDIAELILRQDTIGIANNAFYYFIGLTSVTIPEGVKYIGDCAFMGCRNLTNIHIPEGVTSIPYSTFRECSSLTTIVIPNSVTYLGPSVFMNCKDLVSVELPVGITENLWGAFNGCDSLTDVYYRGTQSEWDEISGKGEELLNANIHILGQKKYITGVSVSIGESLTLNYHVTSEIDPAVTAMRFKYKTLSGEIFTIAEGVYNRQYGEYVFSLTGLTPQAMAESIKAELIVQGENGVESVIAVKAKYSIRQYCDDVLAANPDNKALATLLADLLAYGDAAQDYTGFNASTPVSEGFAAAPSEWKDVTDTDFTLSDKTRDDIRFTSAGVRFAYVNRLYFKIKAADLTGVTLTVNGKTYTAEDLALVEDTADTYIFYTDPVCATEFDKVFTAELSVDGEVIQTLTYSVKSYVYAKQNGENAEMAALVRALYAYGRSAIAYKQEQ